MSPTPDLEKSGDGSPNCAAEHAGQQRQRHVDDKGESLKVHPHGRSADRAYQELPGGADVEQTGFEGNSDRETGKDKGGHLADGFGPCLGASKSPLEEPKVSAERVVAGQQHHNRADK